MFNLYKPFSNIKTEKDFFNFLYDLCTPIEVRELSERWNIAQLLSTAQLTQKEIAKKLDCSIATVTRVSRFLNEEKFGGYKQAIDQLYPTDIQIKRHRGPNALIKKSPQPKPAKL